MTWPDELARIRDVAGAHGVDWAFIAAVRRAEWGAPGREFGVLSVSANDYESQLSACVKTMRNYLLAAEDGYVRCFDLIETIGGFRRLVYSAAFIEYAARRYAPIGASNDPDGLNTAWAGNVTQLYHKFAIGAVPA